MYYDFAVAGRDTPSPAYPPQELVVRGFYRYSRSLAYVGVSFVLFGEVYATYGKWVPRGVGVATKGGHRGN